MKNKFFEDKEIIYNGEQLRSHWIYENADLLGDAIVSFIGEADVNTCNMVDLQDVKQHAPIYSSKMLHFLIEHFNISLAESILRQHLFICIIQNTVNQQLGTNLVTRKGNDLFYKEAKLSVSIATISPLSGLIHVGINIDSKNAPVNAAGLLSEMNIENINDLAIKLMKEYTIEHECIINSSYKVKHVV
jgi:hypothetical protein